MEWGVGGVYRWGREFPGDLESGVGCGWGKARWGRESPGDLVSGVGCGWGI